LIAAERGDEDFYAFYKEATARDVVPVIPAGALAQAWRSSRQVALSRLVNACLVEPLDDVAARTAGELCAAAKTSDVIDASIVVGASRRGDAILTSDPKDLRRLASLAGNVEVIKV
jgi:predicted nucleic acid-binding protein